MPALHGIALAGYLQTAGFLTRGSLDSCDKRVGLPVEYACGI